MTVSGIELRTCRLPTHFLNRKPIMEVGNGGWRGEAAWSGTGGGSSKKEEREYEKRIRRKKK